MRRQFNSSVILFSFILAIFGLVILIVGGEQVGIRTAVLTIAGFYVAVLASVISKHPRDILEADVIFLVVFGMYGVLPLVLAQLPLHLLTDVALWYVTKISADEVVVQCIGIALLSFTIGLWLPASRRLAHHLPAFDGKWHHQEGKLVAFGLMGVGGLLILLLVYRLGLSTFTAGSYLDTFGATSGFGYLVAGMQFAALGILVLAILTCDPNGKLPTLALILLGLYVLANLRFGGRRDAFEPVLAFLVVMHFMRRRNSKKMLVSFALGAVVAFALIGQARFFMSRGVEAMVEEMQAQFSADDLWRILGELQVVTRSTSETAQLVPAREGYRYGATYLEAFEILVPLAVKPERPLSPSQWFVWTRDATKASRGGGYSYSLIAEGYLNFGYFGVALVSFVQGVFIAALVSYRQDNPTSRGRLLLYAVCVMAMISTVRGDFASLLKSYWVIYGIPAFLSAWWLARQPVRQLRPLRHPAVRVAGANRA
jgi:oligosaccharide repeat unit polymerase